MSEIKLPELPEPAEKANAGICCGNFTTGCEYMDQSETMCCGQPDECWPDYFTADQMREYARSAVLAAATPGQVEDRKDAFYFEVTVKYGDHKASYVASSEQIHSSLGDLAGALTNQALDAARATHLASASVSEQKGDV